jgi:predicted RecA/RadA family phage recombinase
MQAVFIQEGAAVDYTPASAVVAGQVVVQVNLVGIAKEAIAANTLGALSVEGIFDVDQAAEIIPAGAAVYWDADGNSVSGTAGAGAATATATGNTFMGFAQAVTAATDSYVRISLGSAKVGAAAVATATSITGDSATLPIAGLSAAQGGAASLAGGASTGGNNNGGSATIKGGAKNGSGVDGVVNVGTTSTSAVNLGAASIPTNVAGPLTNGVGASTAAAGSTNADAQGLPAGTASVYPTTAADDTKGVIVNDADKVTGRMLFIGNGVANKILKVYPAAGGTINGAAANAAFSSVSGKGVVMVCLSSSSNTWLAW